MPSCQYEFIILTWLINLHLAHPPLGKLIAKRLFSNSKSITTEMALWCSAQDINQWYEVKLVNIGLGNGLLPSGRKPLPDPVLTQISESVWCHEATFCRQHLVTRNPTPDYDIIANFCTCRDNAARVRVFPTWATEPVYYSPLHNEVVGGVYWFHTISLSVRLFVCPSICPASCVRSVVPTVLVAYLYILSSNFRSCVVYEVSCKISKL